MTSSNGNIFRVTGFCAGNSPVTGEFPSQRQVTWSFEVFFDLRLEQNGWVNNRGAGDLRRHGAHYDVIVMFKCPGASTILLLRSRTCLLIAAGVISITYVLLYHDDVIKWKHFPRYWSFLRGIHRSPVNSLHKGQWSGAMMFPLFCVLNKRLRKKVVRLMIWDTIAPIMTSESSHGAGFVGAGDTAGDKRQPPVPPVTAGSVSWQLSVFGFRAPALVLNWILNRSF